MPHPLTKCRRRSPASLILDSLGISQAQLADTLGVSQSSLSRALAGQQPVPAGLRPVLRVLIGPTETDRLLTAVGEPRP